VAIREILPSAAGVNLELGNHFQPGDTIRLKAGSHAGLNIWGDFNLIRPDAPASPETLIEFDSGAAIRGGIPTGTAPFWGAQGQGIRVTRMPNLRIVGADIADGIDGTHGCGIWADHCLGLTIENFKIANMQKWGIHFPVCRNVVIRDGYTIRARREHGIYVANSAEDVLIENVQSLRNAACGFQSNGDGTILPDAASGWGWKGGVIRNYEVRNCVFGWNNNGGGAVFNMDSVVGAYIHDNIILPTGIKGNCFALFRALGPTPLPLDQGTDEHLRADLARLTGLRPAGAPDPAGMSREAVIAELRSYGWDYVSALNFPNGGGTWNPMMTRNIRIERNRIYAGAGQHNIAVVDGARDVTFADNEIVHTGWTPGAAKGILELFPQNATAVEGFVFRNNKLSHDSVVYADSNLKTLAEAGVAMVGNVILAAAEIDALKATLPAVSDPGGGSVPVPPPPPPPPPLVFPDTAPAGVACDPALADPTVQGSLWCRDWDINSHFGQYQAEGLVALGGGGQYYQTPVAKFPYGGTAGRLPKGMGFALKGFFRATATDVYKVRFIIRGEYSVTFGRAADAGLYEEGVGGWGPTPADIPGGFVPGEGPTGLVEYTVYLEAGKFYATEFGLHGPDHFLVLIPQVARKGDPEWKAWPTSAQFPPLARPGAVAPPPSPPPPPPPGPLPPPPPPSPPPVPGTQTFSYAQLLEILRAANGA
jgi:hypothetical protein